MEELDPYQAHSVRVSVCYYVYRFDREERIQQIERPVGFNRRVVVSFFSGEGLSAPPPVPFPPPTIDDPQARFPFSIYLPLDEFLRSLSHSFPDSVFD